MSKTKLNTDYMNTPLQCFCPEPEMLSITGGVETDVSTYSVIVMDDDTDLSFNGGSDVYSAWPAHQPLQLTNHINTITFGTSCNLMYML